MTFEGMGPQFRGSGSLGLGLSGQVVGEGEAVVVLILDRGAELCVLSVRQFLFSTCFRKTLEEFKLKFK